MRSVELGVQSRQKRVIEHSQNLFLHFCSLKLLPYGECFSVNNFHGVEALRETHHGVPYLTEVDIPDVAASEAPEEAEVVEADTAFVASETPHGFPCSLVCLVRLRVGTTREGRCVSEGGTNGDGAPATAASEAEVAHPAPGRFRHGDRGAAAVVVGFISAGGGHGGCRVITCTSECVCV